MPTPLQLALPALTRAATLTDAAVLRVLKELFVGGFVAWLGLSRHGEPWLF